MPAAYGDDAHGLCPSHLDDHLRDLDRVDPSLARDLGELRHESDSSPGKLPEAWRKGAPASVAYAFLAESASAGDIEVKLNFVRRGPPGHVQSLHGRRLRLRFAAVWTYESVRDWDTVSPGSVPNDWRTRAPFNSEAIDVRENASGRDFRSFILSRPLRHAHLASEPVRPIQLVPTRPHALAPKPMAKEMVQRLEVLRTSLSDSKLAHLLPLGWGAAEIRTKPALSIPPWSPRRWHMTPCPGEGCHRTLATSSSGSSSGRTPTRPASLESHFKQALSPPEVTPEITPVTTHGHFKQAPSPPEVTPEISPEVSPEISPEVTPEISPEVTPEISPEEALSAALHALARAITAAAVEAALKAEFGAQAEPPLKPGRVSRVPVFNPQQLGSARVLMLQRLPPASARAGTHATPRTARSSGALTARSATPRTARTACSSSGALTARSATPRTARTACSSSGALTARSARTSSAERGACHWRAAEEAGAHRAAVAANDVVPTHLLGNRLRVRMPPSASPRVRV